MIHSLVINLFFFVIVTELLLSIIFLRVTGSRPVIIQCLITIALFIPPLLDVHSVIINHNIIHFSHLLYFTFPSAAGFVIFRQLTANGKIQSRIMLAIGIISILAFLARPEWEKLFIYICHTISYIIIAYHLFRQKLPLYLSFLLSGVLFNIAFITIIFLFLDFDFYLISVGFFALTLFIILMLHYNIRIQQRLNHYRKVSSQNKLLNRNISRLKQSNDQYGKIIEERETDLLQLSRHASLAELTTGIAHELLQPLTGIKGISQNMIDDINYDEFQKLQAVSELFKICSLVDKSSRIIDHIRNFSRKTTPVMKHVDLNAVILDATDLINIQLKNKGIELHLDLEDNLPGINGDHIMLEQTIINFILNSKDAIILKHKSNDNYYGVIKISTSSTQETVILNIEDNGTGMPPEMIEKIWSPFFTTKNRTNGTGVGLSISSKILNEHNARVNVKSSPDGTCFIILFPIREKNTPDLFSTGASFRPS